MAVTYLVNYCGYETCVDFTIDDTDANYTYIGYSYPGTAKASQGWAIIRITKADSGNSNLNTGRWANGKMWDTSQNNGIVWNSRTGYTYGA